MDYPIIQGSRQLGKVQVLKEGLYLKITCRCLKPGEMIYRLVADLDGRQESLGILTPMGDGFGLNRKIPAKKLAGENMSFHLVPSHDPMPGTFVPLSPEEPFLYLDKLKTAHMATKNGQAGLILRD